MMSLVGVFLRLSPNVKNETFLKWSNCQYVSVKLNSFREFMELRLFHLNVLLTPVLCSLLSGDLLGQCLNFTTKLRQKKPF